MRVFIGKLGSKKIMDRKVERFFGEYDEVVHRLAMARERDFAPMLRRWFMCLDQAPEIIASEIRRLQKLENWEVVSGEVMKRSGGMVGSGRLKWPDDRDRRMGGQILLLRNLASEEIRVLDFSLNYFYAGDNNIDSTTNEMASQFFEPHAEELRRRLEDVIDAMEDASDDAIYAFVSDRVIKLDHNSALFFAAIAALDETISHLKESNEIDPEEKVRLEVELNCGLEMAKAPRTRIGAIRVVLVDTLTWIGEKFASSIVGISAEKAVAPIRGLIGL